MTERGYLNGDGFGLGWYPVYPEDLAESSRTNEPCVFTRFLSFPLLSSLCLCLSYVSRLVCLTFNLIFPLPPLSIAPTVYHSLYCSYCLVFSLSLSPPPIFFYRYWTSALQHRPRMEQREPCAPGQEHHIIHRLRTCARGQCWSYRVRVQLSPVPLQAVHVDAQRHDWRLCQGMGGRAPRQAAQFAKVPQ